MHITPLDIRRQRFKRTMRGYDPSEVEAFLEMLAEAWEETCVRLEGCERELDVLRARSADFGRMEGAVREVLVAQQQSAASARDEAEKQAELIVRGAEIKASSLISAARERVQVLTETIRELQDKRVSILSNIRSFIDSQERIIELEETRIRAEIVPADERFPDEEEGDGPILNLSEL